MGRAEKRFLAFQNKDSFWYLSSIFCKQTLLVAMNETSNNGNILRRRTRDIKPCTLGRGAILISPKIYVSVRVRVKYMCEFECWCECECECWSECECECE